MFGIVLLAVLVLPLFICLYWIPKCDEIGIAKAKQRQEDEEYIPFETLRRDK